MKQSYTCHDSQVKIIQWVVEPYVPESDPIIFAASQTVSPEGTEPVSRTPVVAAVTSIMNKRVNNVSGWMADMTTTLTVNTSEVENKTNVTCQTQRGIDFFFEFYCSLYCRLGECRDNNLKSLICHFLLYCRCALPE